MPYDIGRSYKHEYVLQLPSIIPLSHMSQKTILSEDYVYSIQPDNPYYMSATCLKLELYSNDNWDGRADCLVYGRVYPQKYPTELKQSDLKDEAINSSTKITTSIY